MPKMYNPETGKYDIEVSLEEAREKYGYGSMSDAEKRAAYNIIYQGGRLEDNNALSDKELKHMTEEVLANVYDPETLEHLAIGNYQVGNEPVSMYNTSVDESMHDMAEAIVTPHDYAGSETIPSGMIPLPGQGGLSREEMNLPDKGSVDLALSAKSGGLTDDYTTRESVDSMWYAANTQAHTLTFHASNSLKVAYIKALREGFASGMIPANAKLEDAGVTAELARKLGLDTSTVKALGRAVAGTAASALVMGVTGNFPLAAMAYFGVNTLLGSSGKQQFDGVMLGQAAVDGVAIPELNMVLPSGLPNEIFSDYRFICYDRVSLKWYPSDDVMPLNYDGGNDYRWVCLDRVTGRVFKANTIKRPRIFLD